MAACFRKVRRVEWSIGSSGDGDQWLVVSGQWRAGFKPSWPLVLTTDHLQSFGFLQLLFHSRPAFARGLFRCACAVPMGFQAYGEAVTVALQGFELASPIDDAPAHGSPIELRALFDDIFAVAVADPILGQQIISVRVGNLAAGSGVARVPVEHERTLLQRAQDLHRFPGGSGVARG